jgi:hypothetical protein
MSSASSLLWSALLGIPESSCTAAVKSPMSFPLAGAGEEVSTARTAARSSASLLLVSL